MEPARSYAPIFDATAEFILRQAIRSIQNPHGLGRSAAKELIKADLS
jgi:hypothetical protein